MKTSSRKQRKNLKYFWKEIKNNLQCGDERQALMVFMFVINHIRSQGVEEAVRKIEAQQDILLTRFISQFQSEFTKLTEQGRSQKIRYEPDIARLKAERLMRQDTKSNMFSNTMQFIKTKTGLRPVNGQEEV